MSVIILKPPNPRDLNFSTRTHVNSSEDEFLNSALLFSGHVYKTALVGGIAFSSWVINLIAIYLSQQCVHFTAENTTPPKR